MNEFSKSLLRHATTAPSLEVFARLIATRLIPELEVVGVWIWHLRDTGQLENIACYCHDGVCTRVDPGLSRELDKQLRATINSRKISNPRLPEEVSESLALHASHLWQIQIPLDGAGPYFGVLQLIVSGSEKDFGGPKLGIKEMEGLQLATEGIYWRTHFASPTSVRSKTKATSSGLTLRQLRVLNCIDRGLTMRQIGLALNISESTVKQDSQKIYRYFGVTSRGEAIEAARSSLAGQYFEDSEPGPNPINQASQGDARASVPPAARVATR